MKDDLSVNGEADGSSVSGQWIAFYDQAMKIELEDGSRLITNYRYSLKEYVNSDPLKSGAKALAGVETDDYDKFYSQCDRTMVGFVMQKGSTMTNHKIQCVYGVKESAEKPKEDKKAAPASDKPALVNQIIDASVLKEKAEAASKSKNSTTNSTSVAKVAPPKPAAEKIKVGKSNVELVDDLPDYDYVQLPRRRMKSN